MTTRRWVRGIRLGRWQLRMTLMQHRYPTASDRWVLQTSTVYDRRTAAINQKRAND